MDKLKGLIPYLVIVLVVVLIRTFIVTPVVVSGPSMNNTLYDGDVMFLSKISYKMHNIERFDIVVIRTTTKPIIKRIIGLPGEEVYVSKGNVYINDKKLKQSFNYEKDDSTFYLTDIDYKKIPKGMYLVLGDNRDESYDSRYFGLVKKSQIIGKTSFVIFPFDHIGFK